VVVVVLLGYYMNKNSYVTLIPTRLGAVTRENAALSRRMLTKTRSDYMTISRMRQHRKMTDATKCKMQQLR